MKPSLARSAKTALETMRIAKLLFREARRTLLSLKMLLIELLALCFFLFPEQAGSHDEQRDSDSCVDDRHVSGNQPSLECSPPDVVMCMCPCGVSEFATPRERAYTTEK